MIVIPMAGLSQRFRNAGYTVPKYMLDLHGQTLFAHTVGSFKNYFYKEPFLFVARKEAETPAFIKRETEDLGIKNYEIVILDTETKGQAETVRLGLARCSIAANENLTIFNIDTIRPGFQYPDRDWISHADGYLEVMSSQDPGYSYALPKDERTEVVQRTAEKQVISHFASTGLYYFRSAAQFISSFEAEETDPSSHELYIAPMYNHLISSGGDVRYFEINESEVLYAGTPAQYRYLQSLTREHFYRS
jgi:NDP-sugar pyrophosphorylase family protein